MHRAKLLDAIAESLEQIHLRVSPLGEHELHVTDPLGVWGAVLSVRNEPPPEQRAAGRSGPQCATCLASTLGAVPVDLCCLLEAGHEGPHCFQGEHGEVQARRPVAD